MPYRNETMKNQKKYICLNGPEVFVRINELIKLGWEIYSQPVVGDNKSFFCILSTEDIKDELVKVACINQMKGEPYENAPSINFLIGKFLVTIGHWNYVRSWAVQNGYDLPFGRVAKDGYRFDDPEIHFLPVSWVSFFDACKWCNAKSEMEKLEPVFSVEGNTFRKGKPELTKLDKDELKSGYRLPSGKEWLWASKGGIFQSATKYSGGDNFHDVGLEAPFFGDRQEPHGVGEKLPNDLEIYDMSGLAWEWCWEFKNDSAMVKGGWRLMNRFDKPSQDFSMFEVKKITFESPESREAGQGFRIVKKVSAADNQASSSSGNPKENPISPNLTGIGSISLVATHWDKFSSIPHKTAGPIGVAPAKWVKDHALKGVPSSPALPTHQLNRTDVRTICRDMHKDVLFGYVCAMAWGSQGRGRGGDANLKNAWTYLSTSHNKKIFDDLRTKKYSRSQAYSLINGKIPGVGPAYFTKLLFFFSPQPDFYIMDQWTAKSINLITGKKVVIIEQSGAVSGRNTAMNYENYCLVVDEIATHLKLSGADVEEMLMSKGFVRKGSIPPEPWRRYVIGHYL